MESSAHTHRYYHPHFLYGTAIPVIADDFDVDQTLASWVMSVYMITGAVMNILIGNFSDALGAKKMLILLIMIYTIATALAGFSEDINTLLKPNLNWALLIVTYDMFITT